MAISSLHIIDALRKTANNLREGRPYEWGHMGSCNCGNLAQTLLGIGKAEIHRAAMHSPTVGDWNEQLQAYCEVSGLEIDRLIFTLLQKGFTLEDLMQLEYLSNPAVYGRISNKSYLQRNRREDVVLYLETWATLLEEELLHQVVVPEIKMEVIN